MGIIGKVLFLFIFVKIVGRINGDGLDDEVGFSFVLIFDKRYVYMYIMFIRRVCWYRNISISMKEYFLLVWVSLFNIIYFVFYCVCIKFYLIK